MGRSRAPQADPAMGRAALLSAQTGQDALAWAQEQAEISNAWAAEDRERWNTTFKPLEDQFVADAQSYDSVERRNSEANAAGADVQQAMQSSAAQAARQQRAMGVRPGSGRSAEGTRRSSTDMGLAVAGAKNTARRRVEAEGHARKAQAVNLGNKYSVNPGQSLGMATATGSSGFGAAMQGYGQQADILGQQHAQQMQAWQADQNSMSGLFGGLGTLAGYGLQAGWFPSSEKIKTDKRPAKDSLGAVRKMRVEKWRYKDGEGDGGEHIGPYAEEFSDATGMGDGSGISIIDGLGVALGAIKELDAKIDKVAA